MSKATIGAISMDINTKEMNYGSWLHSYAFQQFLLKNDYSCEIVNYVRPDQENYNLKNPAITFLKYKKIKMFIKHVLFWLRYRKKYNRFEDFKRQHLLVSKKYTKASLSNEKLTYNVLICDSDTIWTPRSDGKYDEVYFLALPNMTDAHKIAYSPSMGNAVVPESLENDLRSYLSGFSFISCRESFEKVVLEKYSSLNIEHVLDPVFLLEKKDYLNIMMERSIKEKYILIYQPVDSNDYLLRKAVDYSKKNNLEVFEITTKINIKRDKTIRVLYSEGPKEFLSLISNAEVVFTNSFHAICFSIIFNRPFFAFGRKDNLKVLDICKTFGIEEYYIGSGEEIPLSNVEYAAVNKKLDKLSSDSRQWLLSSIEQCLKEKTDEQ